LWLGILARICHSLRTARPPAAPTPTQPEDHIQNAAGKAYADGIEDSTLKIQLLLGGEKMVNEALRQALELQAVLLAATPPKARPRKFWGSQSPPPSEDTQDEWHAGAVESQATSRVAALMEGRQKTMTSARNLRRGL
jgi:hypothetical protein